MSYFVASGPVRGTCPHKHTSRATAEQCAAKDRRDCRQLGGGAYSDRAAHKNDCRLVRAYETCDCTEGENQ